MPPTKNSTQESYYFELPMINKEPLLIPLTPSLKGKFCFNLSNPKLRSDIRWCASLILEKFHYANENMFMKLYSQIAPGLDEAPQEANLTIKGHGIFQDFDGYLHGQIFRINSMETWQDL
jgi:hypothetical protein